MHVINHYYIFCCPFCCVYYAVVDCGDLTDPANGAVNLTNMTFGSEASYTCDSGYLPSGGSQLRICQANGNWSSSALECMSKERFLTT